MDRVAKITLASTLVASLVTSAAIAQSRVEFHLLPATTTGPMDPDWSPDGRFIAFSMRGDIWKIPAEGGEAIALTSGPDYHFEPDWSPDGQHLAVVVERNGRFDLAWIPSSGLEAGSQANRLTDDPGLDLQPDWSPDGTSLYFSRRQTGQTLEVVSLPIARSADGSPLVSGPVQKVVAGRGHQFFPALSPDGETLAFIGRPREHAREQSSSGQIGSGVGLIHRLGESPSSPRVVIDEETSYRTAPRWSPDGSMLLYSSDEAGSSDLALIPAQGGQRVRLTESPLDEFAPSFSPDGTEIVFVSNHEGRAELYRLATAGGPRSSWQPVRIHSRRPQQPSGRLHARIVDVDGQPLSARLIATASDGRAYTEDDGFQRRFWVNDTHYSHVESEFDLELPAGPARLLVMRGFEYRPTEIEVVVEAKTTSEITLKLERLVDMPELGWYSGDTHSHDLHEGRQGLTQQEFFRFSRADDLHVTNALIHMDGTKLMGRWADLTGEPHLGSDDSYILTYSQEFRGSFGHVALLGLDSFVMPLIGGQVGTAFEEDVLKIRHLEAVREQGGIGGFVHPYNGPTTTPAQAAAADIVVHVALGLGEFYDLISIASKEWPTLEMYYRFLNCGFRLAATGGTDNFSDAFRDPSPGTARTYAYLEGDLSYSTWLDAVREGRTFATSGPLLRLTVDGRLPGDTVEHTAQDNATLPFELEVSSLFPLDSVEVVVNGKVAHSFPARDGQQNSTFSGTVELPNGGWVAARAVGPPHPLVGDEFPFAHTSPVWVSRDGKQQRSSEDARFLIDTIDALWRQIETRDRFKTERSRLQYRSALERARAVLESR